MSTQNSASRIPEILRGKTYLDPTYDTAFKAFFDDAEALKSFVNSVLRLEPGREITELTYECSKPIEFRIPEAKSVVFDILATTADGRFLNIEMQRADHAFFIDRMLLYSAYLAVKSKKEHEKQLEKLNLPKHEFNFHRYEMPETFSIWICNFHPFENFEGYHDTCAIYSGNAVKKGGAQPLSQKMNYILIDLVNLQKTSAEILSTEEKWLYLLKHASENIQFPAIDKTMNEALERIRTNDVNPELLSEQVKDMISQEEIDCQIASGIVKGVEKVLKNAFAQGQTAGLAAGHAAGIAEGLAKGEARGKLAGKLEGIIETAKKMLAEGLSIDLVSSISGIPVAKLKTLQ